jgi:proliferating cell nuclear antigen
MIRDLNSISDRIEIKSVGNDLIFSCDGFASSKIFRSEFDGYMSLSKTPNASVVIQGEFSLKSLSLFTKCTPLCNNLEMYLGNDLPLIIKYNVASLGEIRLCLAPLPAL